jgi:pyridoxal phosphate enzyme (YggS family)
VIAERVAAIREAVSRAAARAGRSPGEITLVAVSKTQPESAIREAFAAGVRHFGENKVQEAEPKIAALADLRPQGLVWHMIGHLQKNKARRAVELFDALDAVDDPDLGRRIERAAEQNRKHVPLLLQVDLAGEETKHGLDEAHLMATLDVLRGFKAVKAEGLMILPPLCDDPEEVRPYFRRLRDLRDEALRRKLLLGRELSMGMSHDFEVAIEEGATQVRIGTALFGPRGTAGGAA